MQGSINEFLKPRVVKVQPVSTRHARIVIEPFERGFGHTLRRGPIAAAALHLERHRQLAGLGQIRDHEIGIQDLDVVVARDVAGRDRPRALLVKAHFGDVPRMHPDRHGLEVEQDVDDILLHALDRRVLVQHALDLDLGDRRTR